MKSTSPFRTAWSPCALAVALALAVVAPASRADTASLSVQATVLSRALCFFTSNAALNLNFGGINPGGTTPAGATTSAQFWCIGNTWNVTYAMTAGDGQNANFPGMRRMRHATSTTDFLPYSLSMTPATGTIPMLSVRTLTINGTIAPGDYQNARAGNYSDTVMITLDP